MIQQIPDAPWIRDAELNGMPDAPDVKCPYCDAINPDTFYVQNGVVMGCSECMDAKDPWEWAADHPEGRDRP